MRKALLALCAFAAIGASAETFDKGTAYAYPIGPDFHYFNNDENLAAMNEYWPTGMMYNGCSFGSATEAAYGTAAVWFNTIQAQLVTVAEADALCPVVPDPWNEDAYALKMQAPMWWGIGNFNFALPATDELCRVRAIFRCDTDGASDARKDNDRGILFRITECHPDDEECFPGPNAKVEIPDIWEHPELYRVVDLYTDQLDGVPYLAISFNSGGFSCGGEQPAFYLEEVSIVPTKLIEGDNHIAGDKVVTAVAKRPELTVIDGNRVGIPDKDKLVAGTVDSPNYYILKAGSGTPFLAYSEKNINIPGYEAKTQLYRTDELTEANIWAVTPGSVEGTLNITAYGSTRGLMKFIIDSGGDDIYYQPGAIATADTPRDIYPLYNMDGTVCLNINNRRGYESNEFGEYNLYTLDATENSVFLGNGYPDSRSTNWTAFKLDMSNGTEAALKTAFEAVKQELEKEALEAGRQAMVEQYTAEFVKYINAVPWVADELRAGIEALNEVEPTPDYVAEIVNIWSEYIDKATVTLNTIFAGKQIVVKNLRRAANNIPPYVSVDAEAKSCPMVATFVKNPMAVITLEVADEGYYFYNAATQNYLSADGDNITTTADKERAQPIKLTLNSANEYVGINMLLAGIGSDNNALNVDENSSANLVCYSPSDEGSIWSVVYKSAEADDVAEIIDNHVAQLESYLAAVPVEVANILTAAIDEIKSMEYSVTIAIEADEIVNNAISAVNASLATVYNGRSVALKNLRRVSVGTSPYVGIRTKYNQAEYEYYGVKSLSDATSKFTFISNNEGGYTIYNGATKTWLSLDDSTPTTNKEDAQVLYPVLYNYGAYAGIALSTEPEKTDLGLNFQDWEDGVVCFWGIADEGSIWSLVIVDEYAVTQDVIDVNVGKLEPYVAALPPMIADILTAAIDEIKALEYSENIGTEAEMIAANALAAANEFLASGLNGMKLTLKNLRQNKFISISDGEWVYDTNNEALETTFTFKYQSDGGYILYNEAANIYVGEAVDDENGVETIVTVSANEATALVVYPTLCKSQPSDLYGVALALESDLSSSTMALNTNNNHDIFHTYYVYDRGSIWALEITRYDANALEVVDRNVAKLEPYMAAVPKDVANILTAAIDEIKALEYSENIGTEAETIAANALAAANEFLASSMNGMKLTLKNLRQNMFVSIVNDEWVHAFTNDTEETVFDFISKDGGYILYNESANIYVGRTVPGNHYDNNVIVAHDETDAMVVYPFLCQGEEYFGVALAIEENPSESTWALNTNDYDYIFHTYPSADPGSIFALLPPNSVTTPNVGATAIKLHGIVGKVGECIEVSAVFEPDNVTNPTINWSSSNPAVAAVDGEGTVWFNAAGSAVVTAECQGYEFSVPFVVKEVVAMALNVFPVEAVGGIGHQFSLLALHEPENTTDKSVTWESADPEIATVSEDGRVELLALGTTQITARSGEHTAVCDITVDKTVNLTEMASTGVVINIVENGIVVRNAPIGESIAVYSVDGKVVNGAIVESEEARLNLAAGIYIVKVSPATIAKVLI